MRIFVALSSGCKPIPISRLIEIATISGYRNITYYPKIFFFNYKWIENQGYKWKALCLTQFISIFIKTFI